VVPDKIRNAQRYPVALVVARDDDNFSSGLAKASIQRSKEKVLPNTSFTFAEIFAYPHGGFADSRAFAQFILQVSQNMNTTEDISMQLPYPPQA